MEPDSIKPLAVGKNCMLQVSACRARDEAEGLRVGDKVKQLSLSES